MARARDAASNWRRWLRGALALAGAGYCGLIIAIAATYWGIYGCDETCGRQAGWRNDPDAWQWTAQLCLGATALGAMGVGTIGLFRRELGRSAFVYAAGLALALVWAVWMF